MRDARDIAEALTPALSQGEREISETPYVVSYGGER